MKVIYIAWVDAHGGSGQYSRSEAEEAHTDYMFSAGVLIKETETAFTIVQDIFRYNERPEQVREYEVIPKVNIVSFEIFEPKEEP